MQTSLGFVCAHMHMHARPHALTHGNTCTYVHTQAHTHFALAHTRTCTHTPTHNSHTRAYAQTGRYSTGTNFPMPCLQGSMWNPKLVEQAAGVIAMEVRHVSTPQPHRYQHHHCHLHHCRHTYINTAVEHACFQWCHVTFVTSHSCHLTP
jgi:hypothetical protein